MKLVIFSSIATASLTTISSLDSGRQKADSPARIGAGQLCVDTEYAVLLSVTMIFRGGKDTVHTVHQEGNDAASKKLLTVLLVEIRTGLDPLPREITRWFR